MSEIRFGLQSEREAVKGDWEKVDPRSRSADVVVDLMVELAYYSKIRRGVSSELFNVAQRSFLPSRCSSPALTEPFIIIHDGAIPR